ncbi:MAG TPA: hypothetical protein VF529_01940 [Solirubrobacteraceae bacterium]|jgi:hypothetical protein
MRRAAAILALCGLVLAAAAAAAAAPPAKRPSGTYSGDAGNFTMIVAGRAIDLAAFEFPCPGTTGRTSINRIPIRKVRGVWRFSIRTYGSATYADDHPDENVRIRFSGRFSPSGKVAVGRLTVSSPHCGRGKATRWSAHRREPQTL